MNERTVKTVKAYNTLHFENEVRCKIAHNGEGEPYLAVFGEGTRTAEWVHNFLVKSGVPHIMFNSLIAMERRQKFLAKQR